MDLTDLSNENQAVNKIRETFMKAVMCESKTKSARLLQRCINNFKRNLYQCVQISFIIVIVS